MHSPCVLECLKVPCVRELFRTLCPSCACATVPEQLRKIPSMQLRGIPRHPPICAACFRPILLLPYPQNTWQSRKQKFHQSVWFRRPSYGETCAWNRNLQQKPSAVFVRQSERLQPVLALIRLFCSDVCCSCCSPLLSSGLCTTLDLQQASISLR